MSITARKFIRSQLGEPTTTRRGNFRYPSLSRTYTVSGLVADSTAAAGANGTILRSVISSGMRGDCVILPAGRYHIDSVVRFTTPGMVFRGSGSSPDATMFEQVNELQATWYIEADDVQFYNFCHRVMATARSSQGQAGEGNTWIQAGAQRFVAQDYLAWGSRDAAIFFYDTHHFRMNRVESRDSKSDAWHITNGSSYGEWYDCISKNSGDDGLGFVGYGPTTQPHHHTIVRHYVNGQTWGRGFGIIHTHDITFYGPTLVEDAAGSGLNIAREPHIITGYPATRTGPIDRITVHGELRLRRSNHATPDLGAILIHNPDANDAITNITIDGPVVCVNTGINRSTMPSRQIGVFGDGLITASIAHASFYGVGPVTRLYQNTSPTSTLTTIGWSSATTYTVGPEPPFPLP